VGNNASPQSCPPTGAALAAAIGPFQVEHLVQGAAIGGW
jgi:hypothetical protein